MRGDAFYIGPWPGGINLRDKFLELPGHQLPIANNVFANEDGVLKKRYPCANVAGAFAGGGAVDLFSLYWSKTQHKFLCSGNAKIYSVVMSTGVTTDITGAAVLNINNSPVYIEAPTSGGQGPIYIMPQFPDTPLYWTGGGNVVAWTASAGTLPSADYMVYFKNRVIIAGVAIGASATGVGLKASAVGDPRNWDTTVSGSSSAWQTDIEPSDGEAITAIIPWKSYLLVFKETKIYLVYDLDSGAYRLMSSAIGTVAPKSVCSTPFGIAFLGIDNHVYLTDGSKLDKITDILTYTGDVANYGSGSGSFGGRQAMKTLANTVFWDGKLYLSGMAANSAGGLWVYDFRTQAWWHFGGVQCNAMVVAESAFRITASSLFGAINHFGVGSTPSIWNLFAQDIAAGVWKDGSTTGGVGGAAYPASFATAPLGPMWFRRRLIQDYNSKRRFHAIRGYISGTCDISYAVDQLNTTVPTYTALASVANGNTYDTPVEQTYFSMGVGNGIRYKFSSLDTNAFAVHPFSMYTQHRTD